MIDRLVSKKVVGLKQSLKVIRNGSGKVVYIAKDCDKKIFNQVKKAAEDESLDVVYVDTMKELGNICGIDVGAAIAVTLD